MKPFVSSAEICEYIDYKKPVEVYRNLHHNCFSVRQDGIVCCHAEEIPLILVEFRVGKKGRERVISEKRKNVHAFVRGTVSAFADDIYHFLKQRPLRGFARYNPYESDQFIMTYDKPEDGNPTPVKYAAAAFCYFSTLKTPKVAVYGTIK